MTPFDDASISRRDFVRLSAATGAALSLPGNATANADVTAFDAEYRYVQNHTPLDYSVPTLIRVSDAAGLDAVRAATSAEVLTTETPEPAAYAKLTTAQAVTVAELPTAENLSFSPGSNPFWRLGYYPLGVFPEATRSVDFISYEQLTDGLAQLEAQYPSRVRVQSIGKSPGHTNNLTDRNDPKDIFVAEVTNYDSDASFEEKEKIFYSCSLHGLERAGAEAGARIIENIARGDDKAGSIPDLLDDAVFIFGFTNPDGWAVRNPQYDSGWQTGGPGASHPRAPAAPLYERGNAEIYDTNRQYPTVGYITTAHNPGEPEAAPDYIREKVPDALAIVEHFRGYENLNYGADLHGGPIFSDFVLGLISQDQYTLEEAHEVYAMCEVIKENLDGALSEWQTIGDATEPIRAEFGNPQGLYGGALPDDGFDYATIYDTIDYTVSGAMLDWMAHPEELGGLGMTTLDFEMSFSHMAGGNVFNPELLRMEVIGYREAIRTISDFAVRNSDTPTTADEFDTTVDTKVETGSESDGERVAYVTPTDIDIVDGEVGASGDPLTRSADDLEFASDTAEVDSFTRSGTIGPGATGAETTVEEPFHTDDLDGNPFAVDASLSWTPPGQDLEFYLQDPDGKQIGGAATASNPETISAPLEKEGTYTFIAETYANVAAQYTIEASFTGESSGSGSGSETETAFYRQSTTVTEQGTTTATQEIPEGLHSMQVHTHAHSAVMDLELVSPSGDVVRSFEGITEKRVGGKCCGFPEWDVAEPEAGEWTLRLTNLRADASEVEVMFGTLSSGANPDPEAALGYSQRDYEVTPFQFFADYDAAVRDAGELVPVSVAEVADGGLDGFDHAVVIHDFVGAEGRISGDATAPDYVAALDEFVDAGNNLVVTDTGVNLLRALDNDLVADGQFADGDVQTVFQEVARYTEKDLSHPLLTDVRPIQNQLWKVAPLGYKVNGEAPNHLVNETAFTTGPAVSSVAGRTDGQVATGSLTPSSDSGTGIHVVGSLLPPASQSNLHPFGVLDYTVSFLGYLVFTSALGFQQVRTVGDEEFTFGRGDDWSVDTAPTTVSATRTGDDGTVLTTGQTYQATVEVSADGATEVRDTVPDGWTVVGTSEGSVDDSGEATYVVADATDGSGTVDYFAEAPDSTGQYTFGPAAAKVDGNWLTASGSTKTVTVVGASQNTASDTGATADGTTNDGADDATGSVLGGELPGGRL
ncbi:M14 family metallopeptidase [Halorarius litoreus]|uniref:M14 family metallopeptidase n=1 Tax=Halorarius litoreus TaxID=2962676 RepID=UPI0020CE00E7|nr:M14 family metallopeptidase [Halorarius litoreus]